MHRNKVGLLFLVLCYCYWTIESSPIASKKPCSGFKNDQDIIKAIPFSVEFEWSIDGSAYSMDETNTFVTYLFLNEVGETVPEIIFCLKNLENLIIADMKFVANTVPDALGNLRQLNSFVIHNTSISHMTNELGSLKNLHSLSLEYCSISKLPDLSKLHYLYELRLSNNHLTEVHGLNSINRLLLDNNLFTKLPSMIDPESLQYLSMGGNPVRDFTNLPSFINLEELSLTNASLTSVPSNIHQLTNLSKLDLSNNQLSSVSDNIFNIPHIFTLSITDNLLTQTEIERIEAEFNRRRPIFFLNA